MLKEQHTFNTQTFLTKTVKSLGHRRSSCVHLPDWAWHTRPNQHSQFSKSAAEAVVTESSVNRRSVARISDFSHLGSFFAYFSPPPFLFFFHEQRITGWQHQCKTKQSKRWSPKCNLSSDIFSICILSRTRQRKQMHRLVCLLRLAAMLLFMYILNRDVLPYRRRMHVHVNGQLAIGSLYGVFKCSFYQKKRGDANLFFFLSALFWKVSFVRNCWVTGNNTQPLQI